MLLCDFQLLQNEVDMNAIDEDWYPVLNECTSVCLCGDPHKDCNICGVLGIQLRHCASCDIDICVICSRICAVISMHYAKCRQLQQQGCRFVEYLPASPNPALDTSGVVGMVPLDRVRVYLLSVFPVSGHNDGENKLDGSFDNDSDDHDDDEEEEGDKGSYDSDSSEDSIMMPSFTFGVPSSQKANKSPSFPAREGIADQTGRDLPSLSGRGINSAANVPVANVHAAQQTKPLAQALGGAVAAETSDPRVCMSFHASAGTAGLRGGAIYSVPVTGGLRPRGKIHYGTKTELCQFANLWQVHADDARRDGTWRPGELPVEGVILRDFRKVSCLYK